ncbi:MAG TPA: Rab family GTPase [Vicinamibacterales bacterium]|jgi:small GTP-binding protein
MIQKKICMLGGFAVGKTSLVSRFVRSIFSDKYLTTVGVKIDKKPLTVDGHDVTLMLWDLYGQDEFQSIQETHLRGTAAYLLVVDGTRPATVDMARQLQQLAERVLGGVPFVVVLNKSDLVAEWRLDENVAALFPGSAAVVRASAKSGDGVEDAFATLTRALVKS